MQYHLMNAPCIEISMSEYRFSLAEMTKVLNGLPDCQTLQHYTRKRRDYLNSVNRDTQFKLLQEEGR